jgi:hypothetical protein
MKALLLMDSPEYLRFFDSAIAELARRGHQVALAVNGDRGKKPIGVEGLAAYGGSITAIGVVPQPEGLWHGVARGLRGTMDFVRFLHPRLAAAPALRARIKRKVLPRAYAWLDRLPHLSPAAVHRVQRVLMTLEQAIPLHQPIVRFLRDEAPDVLLVSPLVAAASDQVDWIKAARALGVRTAVCVASWDNLTNKGLLRIAPDLVVVWNDVQRREAEEYHYMPATKVVATGAQPFDRWFDRRVTRGREEFCRRVGLPDARPFLLFTGSSSFISESSAEVAFVRRWVEAVRRSGDPAVASANILMRPHPYNYHRWASDPLADVGGVSVFPRSSYNPIEPENRDDFYDSLAHCAAVVGINTSAMIEAGIVGRPVFSISAPEFTSTQEGTLHFHYLLPEHGGFVRVAAGIDEHVGQLEACLRDPEAAHAETRRFVASFIRPHGIERPATPIFVDTIERLASAPAPAPRSAPVLAAVWRPVLLALAAPVPLAARLPGLSLAPLRRQWDVFFYRTGKRVTRTVVLTKDRSRRVVRGVAKLWNRSRLRWQQRARAR